MSAARKTVDGQAAVVRAAFAFCHACRKFQRIDLFDRKHRGLVAAGPHKTFPRDKRRTERAHDPRNIGADRFAARDTFKASQNGVVIKRSALYDDMAAEFGSVGYFDDLE